ncbi:MAG TPA: alkaline phosphatase D family protein [Candidatus Binatia bacterium]|nr:alkaline phosphatase D family protein [Candidatus Binatia bacterium]
MGNISRRDFLAMAAVLGAEAAWGRSFSTPSKISWRESRDLFPEGVASGDPDSNSVLLWTRHAPQPKPVKELIVEVALDQTFQRVIATKRVSISAEADWTCRVLVGGLKPAQVYWYRFTDPEGSGSRLGRTITAPADDDSRPVHFAFVSCQNANLGAQNAYRRMIFEDERASEQDRLSFVLHLGDFIYELVWYPEDRATYYDRKVKEIVHYPKGEKIHDFHIPVDVDDYRAVYRAYLRDPDLQDARARWPFVPMWDNHEYSWQGWQALQVFDGKARPAQTRKVAAMQAFFEYQPARMVKSGGPSLEEFNPPKVQDAPVTVFDEHGLGQEANNLAAIHSLKGYRSLRWGRNVELMITDERTYRSEDPGTKFDDSAFFNKDYSEFVPEEVLEIVDGGRDYNGGKPPDTIRFGDKQVPNLRKADPAQTILGAEQKAWFLERLQNSKAPWKIWGSTASTLDMRADPLNLPAGMVASAWPGAGYASFGGVDFSTAPQERGEIYDFIRAHAITGLATVAGDAHSFWAGLSSKSLPPKPFDPVGVAFVVGSISAPGAVEAMEHQLHKDAPLRALFVGQGPGDNRPQPTINMLVRHGVRSCLEYAKSGDVQKARQLSNPDLSPHLSFIDMGGHGYAVVHAAADRLETEFVCVPRPIVRQDQPDGGPILYRVRHGAKLWGKHERPNLEQKVIEGNPAFSI